MVHNQTLSSPVAAELSESLQESIGREQLHRLEQTIGLPATLLGFLLLTLAVLLVCAGMGLLVMTSVQTFQTRHQIAKLEQQFDAVERQNAELVWQIAQNTSLQQVRQRALALGYEAPAVRHFVTMAPTTPAHSADPILSAAPSDRAEPIPGSDLLSWLNEQITKIRSWW